MYKDGKNDQEVICDNCKTVLGYIEDLSDTWGFLDCIEIRFPDRHIKHFCDEKCLMKFMESPK